MPFNFFPHPSVLRTVITRVYNPSRVHTASLGFLKFELHHQIEVIRVNRAAICSHAEKREKRVKP